MKKNGYAESTIGATGKRLKSLAKNCDLSDPENVKGYVAMKECSNGFKETLIETYDFFVRSVDGVWDKPFMKDMIDSQNSNRRKN
jgi:hypothetical protein